MRRFFVLKINLAEAAEGSRRATRCRLSYGKIKLLRSHPRIKFSVKESFFEI